MPKRVGGIRLSVYFVACFAVMLTFGFIIFPNAAFASAGLYFSPASGNYSEGQSFTANIYVSSPTQSMNASSGTIIFDQNVLQVVSVSKSGSIMSLWVANPSFDNTAGTISYSGIVLNPGFEGSAGLILAINFKTIAPGQTNISFSSGSVLANDGQGTNIVSGLGSGVYNISSGSTPTAQASPAPTNVANAPTAVAKELPPAPIVTSTTHPDQNSWYANVNPVFSWVLPAGVNAVNFYGDHNPNTDPGSKSDGLIKTYTYHNVDDGIWYFHIKFRNSQGWGPTTHFKFQVDTKNPDSLDVAYVSDSNKLAIKANDALSGIDHYGLQFDSGTVQTWKDDGSGLYDLSALSVGSHSVVVTAYDKAGNYINKSLSFNVPVKQNKAKWPFIPKVEWIRILKYILYALAFLLGLWILLWIAKKISKLFGGGLGRKSKASVLESIEILERTARHRQLTHEEDRVLGSLRTIIYGTVKSRKPYLKEEPGIKIIDGWFDGQGLVTDNGKKYPMSANYASKSLLVEGDQLRLAVHEDGTMIYKQTGPVERHKQKGVLGEQDNGEYRVIAGGKAYKVLPATLTFFRAEPGDEVEIEIPKDRDAEWAAIGKVIKHHHYEQFVAERSQKAASEHKKIFNEAAGKNAVEKRTKAVLKSHKIEKPKIKKKKSAGT